MTLNNAIDVHNHLIPDFLVEQLRELGPLPAGLRRLEAREWSASSALDQLDRNGVRTAVLSAIPLHDALGPLRPKGIAALTRRVNEYATSLRHTHRGRFGLFSFLPMPEVELSLREIEYSLDVLKADGVGLCTRYGEQSIADPAFVPVLAELDRRGAVTFCHPDVPACCAGEDGALGHPYDTGRAVFKLLLGGTLSRFPHIRWIFCHGGGTVPVLSGRVSEMVKGSPALAELMPYGIEPALQALHYETGNAATRPAMAALLACAPVSQILFGTDAPYFGIDVNLANLRANDLSKEQFGAIESGNARRLLPNLG